jgi:hypothetical protein
MGSTHIRWLEESLEKNTDEQILKAENGKIGKDKESMTEKRNQVKLLWFQTGGVLNFITAAPHCGASLPAATPGISYRLESARVQCSHACSRRESNN